jgi:hypothetical protein
MSLCYPHNLILDKTFIIHQSRTLSPLFAEDGGGLLAIPDHTIEISQEFLLLIGLLADR